MYGKVMSPAALEAVMEHLQAGGGLWLKVHGDGNERIAVLILGLCPANERRRYFVTTSLIGWAQT